MNLSMNTRRVLSKVIVAPAVALAAFGSQASPILFVLTGDFTASWQIDSLTRPDYASSGFFDISNYSGFIPSGEPGGRPFLRFNSSSRGGGMLILDPPLGPLMLSSGPQLYTGTDLAPTFTLGSFTLNNLDSPGHFTLKISEAAAVPEPATLALALAALGLSAVVPTRRRGAFVLKRG